MIKLVEKLSDLQKELKAPKGQYNSFGKYHYRSAEDILEAVKPLNAERGLLLSLSDQVISEGDRVYIRATATITDGENELTVTAYAREPLTRRGMDESQITGTASSYARKYALNGLYLIDDTKDADTDTDGNKNESDNRSAQQQKVDTITQKQIGELKVKVLEFAKLRKRTKDEVFGVLKISNVETLTKAQAASAINQLKIWIAGAKNDDTKNQS